MDYEPHNEEDVDEENERDDNEDEDYDPNQDQVDDDVHLTYDTDDEDEGIPVDDTPSTASKSDSDDEDNDEDDSNQACNRLRGVHMAKHHGLPWWVQVRDNFVVAYKIIRISLFYLSSCSPHRCHLDIRWFWF